MSKIQNIDSHIIADVAERIERLITDARANVARAVNITEVITKYDRTHYCKCHTGRGRTCNIR